MGIYYGSEEVKSLFSKGLRILYPALIIIPLIFIMGDYFTFKNFSTTLNERTITLLKVTLFQSAISAVFCTLFSIAPTAYLTKGNSNKVISNLIESTFFIPFFYPVASTVVSFSIILSNKYFNLQYSFTAVIIAHVFYNTPIMIKYISSSMLRINNAIKENALIDTLNAYQRIINIYLPIIMKSFLRGFFLVFCFCFTSFGIILALGNIRLTNFETAIYQSLNMNFDFSTAISYALIQFIFLSFINIYISKSAEEDLDEENKLYSGENNRFIVIFSLLYILFEFTILIAPVLYLIKVSIYKKTNFLFLIFSEAVNSNFKIINGILNSIIISFTASILVIPLVYILIRNKSKLTEFIITSSFGLSPAIISISYVYLSIITGMPILITGILGFIVISVPFAYSFLHHHVAGFDKIIIEAASLDTESKIKIFRFIEFPIIKPILLTSFLNTFALLYGEFTFAYIISNTSSLPLISSVNFSLNSQRKTGLSLAVNFINLVLIFSIFIVSKSILTRNSSKEESHADSSKHKQPLIIL